MQKVFAQNFQANYYNQEISKHNLVKVATAKDAKNKNFTNGSFLQKLNGSFLNNDIYHLEDIYSLYYICTRINETTEGSG